MKLHDQIDKLFTEVDHLERITETYDFDEQQILLGLSVAKKVRRAATMVIAAFAEERDNLKPTEAQGND